MLCVLRASSWLLLGVKAGVGEAGEWSLAGELEEQSKRSGRSKGGLEVLELPGRFWDVDGEGGQCSLGALGGGQSE